MSVFQAERLTDRIYWVGAVDWAVRDFHGYSTGHGSTYNAYLVMADRITLIDTVKRPFLSQMMDRIASVCDPSDIDIIVSNHSEMDHSGALPETIGRIGPSAVYASRMGAKALEAHFHWQEDTVRTVGTGDTLDLGGATLEFRETRMLHWPDSMVSYMPEEKVLFSQDGFGMHLATSERYGDQVPRTLLETEARKYYANILMPYSQLVRGLLADIRRSGLEIELLCPDHGPVWRSDIGWITGMWDRWAEKPPSRKAVVVYDTMWGSTASMAHAVSEGLGSGGASVRLLPLRATHISDVAAEVLEASALLVGSPTLNGRIFPSVAECLNYLGGLKPAGLVGAAFGSYGWSGEAVRELNGILEGMKVRLLGEGLRTLYVPGPEILDRCFDLGAGVAEELEAMTRGNE
ncbi:MAG: MBL fold metallo-hydrolase [Candidatus Aegiribacteria sp. MLS_C]|nr:MAG: MBL fold metallo-hydrolase [Candidatus Aegiribacteria sp. MLS_C]